MRRLPRTLVLVLSALVSLTATPLAPAANAAPAVGPPTVRAVGPTTVPLPNLQNVTTDWDRNGIQCHNVPLPGGGTAALSMLITSDSRRRVATATYTYSVPYLNAEMPLGVGSVTVLTDTRTSYGKTTVSQRPRVQLEGNDSCDYSTVGLVGVTEVMHHTPVKRPTLAAVQTWCTTQPWFTDLPQYCPTWLATA
jgi:hypothetical protein